MEEEKYLGPLEERCKKIKEKRIKIEKIKELFFSILFLPFRILMTLIGIGIIVFFALSISPVLVFLAVILGFIFIIVIFIIILALILYVFSKKFREEVKEESGKG